MGALRTGRRRGRLRVTAAFAVALGLGVVLALLPLAIPGPETGLREAPGANAAGSNEPGTAPPRTSAPTPDTPPVGPPGSPVGGPNGQPNIVLVVMDDFSVELLRTMPNLVALQQSAASYENAFVVNSLCCPSRAATFTGLPPHLNGVLANTSGGPLGALGGYPAFDANNDAERSYNVSLQNAGYRTGFVGKYLNEYEPPLTSTGFRIAPPLIPGWDDFEAVSGGAYQGWGFYATHKEGDTLELRDYPRPDRELPARAVDQTYAGSVIADEALRLLRRYQRRDARRDQPWLLHVAPYGTHARTQPSYPGEPLFPPALRDRPRPGRPGGNCGLVVCDDLTVADLPGYADPGEDNAPYRIDDAGLVTPAPTWRTELLRLTEARGSQWYRQRAQMAQSIDRMIGRMIGRLDGQDGGQDGALDDDTYLIVTSDNGFHLGQHSLNGGKGLPYDSDSRVPLVVAGPGVVAGQRAQAVSNVDLAPTLEALAGATPSGERAGTSFADSFRAPEAPGGRYVFMEHAYGPVLPGEPDADLGSGSRLDIIPSYVAVRGESGLLVRVDLDPSFYTEDFAWELYRYDQPWEDVNVFDTDHDLPYALDLRDRLERWVDCTALKCRRLTR